MNILVCDDHALMRSALAMVVERIAPDGVVLLAADWDEAWARAEATPDLSLCLIDLQMPGMESLDGLRGLRARAPNARTVVVTGSERDEDLLAALSLGVEGFIPKSAESEVLTAAIQLVLAGGRYLPARLAEISAPTAGGVEAPLGRLSERQVQVLRGLSEGRPNKEIARDLGLAPNTVKTHVGQVMALLGVSNRTEAAIKARSLGLI